MTGPMTPRECTYASNTANHWRTGRKKKPIAIAITGTTTRAALNGFMRVCTDGGSLHAMRVRNDLNGCNRLELLNQSAAATAAATGSTGIAVVAHLDRSILNSVESQRCDVKRITGVVKN